ITIANTLTHKYPNTFPSSLARRPGSANREMGRLVRLVLGAAIFDSLFFKKEGNNPLKKMQNTPKQS
ncbi:MAG: hypothetical protein AAF696_36995, partial [Bacteroidota bacterium]